MCLKITQLKPFNNSKIRYKLLERNGNNYYSFYQGVPWLNNEIIAKKVPYEGGNQIKIGNCDFLYGIHTFTKFKDALLDFEMAHLGSFNPEVVLVSVEVEDFIAAGEHYQCSRCSDGRQGECWRYAKIKKVLRVKERYF